MTVEDDADLVGLRRVGQVVAQALETMRKAVRPGICPAELDGIGDRVLNAGGARSAPRLAYDFPASTCISVGDAVAHGIADERPLEQGQLINIDVSAELNGYWADSGASMIVGSGERELQRLIAVTRTAQRMAMLKARAGRRMNVIGRTVEQTAKRAGYRVCKELSGHGVGRAIHEEPCVVNWYDPGDPRRLHRGLVITIEPFLTRGSAEIYTDADGWTLRTADGAPMAQFEHTLVVTDGKPIIVTELAT